MPIKYGFIPKNEDALNGRWRQVIGSRPDEALVYINQNSPAEFDSGISYTAALGEQIKNQNISAPYWNLPFPGPRQIEGVADGTQLDRYRRAVRNIKSRYDPAGTAPIPIRPPWEGNLEEVYQSNAAVDRNGNAAPELFKAAFRNIATVIRQEGGPRFLIDWNTNLLQGFVKPELLYPGDDVVDVITQDWYYQDWMADLGWGFEDIRSAPYGVQWGANFAALHGKPYGWTEYGVRTKKPAGPRVIIEAHAWAKTIPHFRHAHYWDRTEVIDSQISTGVDPALLLAYRASR